MSEQNTILEETRASLLRVQDFDTKSLIQERRLGEHAFDSAVEPANRLTGLFSQLPVSALENFPDSELRQIKKTCDAVFSIFQEIKSFDLEAGDNNARKASLVEKLSSQYQNTFSSLIGYISYSVARTVDFSEREAEARAVVQATKDQLEAALNELASAKNEADATLEGIKRAGAESGVTKQAYFFETSAKEHKELADKWQYRTNWFAAATGAFGALTLFFHKIPFLAAANSTELIQITSAKVLIFFVLVFMLLLSARNLRSHRHNEIVARHRQNALLTYKAIAEASSVDGARDIILSKAAEAIYAFQDTGYIRACCGRCDSDFP